jgi:hypothetical protein
LFENQILAEQAVGLLTDTGFPPEDISILMAEPTHGHEFGVESESKAPEGATTGAVVGGVIGAIAAGVAAVGTITVPGLGVIAAGWIVSALAGASIGAAAGGLVGALIGLGVPEHEAKFYAEEVQKGGVLVGIRTQWADRAQAAEEILKRSGGRNIRS